MCSSCACLVRSSITRILAEGWRRLPLQQPLLLQLEVGPPARLMAAMACSAPECGNMTVKALLCRLL